MLLIAIAWIYVVLMMAVVEATGGGTLLQALFIVLFYGALPLSVVWYVLRAARRPSAPLEQPDNGGHAPGGAIAPERIEP